jgi:hypothetical protein
MMNPRRFPTVGAALCGTVVLASWIGGSLVVLSSASFENAGAVPIEDRSTPALTASAERADAPQATAVSNTAAVSNTVVANADVATVAEPVKGMAPDTPASTDTTAASDEPESIIWAALPEPSQTRPPETPPVQLALVNTSDPVPEPSQMRPPETPPVQLALANTSDPMPDEAKAAVSTIETVDECLVGDICIDRYLWELYQRTPKQDTIKEQERRKVTVKKRGKTVTVTRSFVTLVPEDFSWKDPKAAERAGMPMTDYVIGGMDRSFKLKLYYTLRAAEQAGLSPGITSAFRDDYRQSIASGLKAATDRSYHGGSFRGGYGHGLAADVVSVKGGTQAERWTATENLWKWIDAHGKEFGIGRPYLDRDPPHLAPVDGLEYAAHHGGTKTRHAESDVKKRTRLAARDPHSATRTRTTSARPRKADLLAVAQVPK